ncbi:MAG TPA: sigma-70 family RNA polymerase sigma factor [Blastocatellia bacterium]|jgi:RNA polymerase sigma-70 factor (ECF subfamily)|nr:sigma-70 family RNA polymerase sigma factor [Blastocatellia bacterium]
MEDLPELVDHLFRHEAGKMVSYLTRIVGLGRLDLAEDVVQDTLCRALETWPIHGLPDNPSAWLMRAARNRAIDLLRRDDRFRYFTPELTYLLRLREDLPIDAPAFEKEIQDDQLRMMFSCCHPELSTEAQAQLILKTLCGFSVSEIAHAFLVSENAIEKRLGRARKLFRRFGTFVEIADASEIRARMDAVYQAIYLLFNEGYHGSRSDRTEPEDLCLEAIRLALLLSEHPEGGKPKTYALLALLCFHAARLPGRRDVDGSLIQLELQNRFKWDRDLMGRGFHFLDKASVGTELSEYHLEAAIAALHCAAPTYEKTEWTKILELYDLLYRLKPTPIVALNRAIALGQAVGPEEGLAELSKIPDPARLKDYPFYPAAEGEFHLLAGRPAEAAKRFEEAAKLARSRSETDFFERKLKACQLNQDNQDWNIQPQRTQSYAGKD